jgi:hypothetical protein
LIGVSSCKVVAFTPDILLVGGSQRKAFRQLHGAFTEVGLDDAELLKQAKRT